MELFIVHDGGPVNLMGEEELDRHVLNLAAGEIISDRAAQTIAALWHHAGAPLVTALSTQGKVDRRLAVEDLCPEHEIRDREALGHTAMAELRALQAYIEHHIAAAPSGSRPCACQDCMDLTTGIIGEMCGECEADGCEYGEECSRGDAYALECGCNATVGCDGGCGTACD